MKQIILFFIMAISFVGCCDKRNAAQQRLSSFSERPKVFDLLNDDSWNPLITTEHPVLMKNMERLIGAIVNNDKNYVLYHIDYPISIGDGYPLHTIMNAHEMSYIYDKVFDDSLRSVIREHMDLSEYEWFENEGWHCTFNDDNLIMLPDERIMSAYGAYLWFTKDDDHNCSISTINYSSLLVKGEREKLLRMELASLPKSLQDDGIEPYFVFKAEENDSTTWIGRIDHYPYPYLEKSFHFCGVQYPYRIALYRNSIVRKQRPDFVYYGINHMHGSYTFMFIDQYENTRAALDRVKIGPVDAKFGDFFYLDGKGPMECEEIYWLDELKRK